MAKRAAGRTRPVGSKRPNAESVVRGLTRAGVLNPKTTVAQMMNKVSLLERELGSVGYTIVYDSDKYALVIK